MSEESNKINAGSENRPAPVPRVDEVGKTPDTKRRYFAMFEQFALKMKPVHEIAKDFGCSKQTVYLALTWVEQHEPKISHGVRLISAIRSKEDSIRMLRRERDAISDVLDKRRAAEAGGTEYKGPKYSHYHLEAVMRSLKDEEAALWKFYGIAKDELADALGKLGRSIEDTFPTLFAHLAGVRPRKYDEPDAQHTLREGITTGDAPAPAPDQGEQGRAAAA